MIQRNGPSLVSLIALALLLTVSRSSTAEVTPGPDPSRAPAPPGSGLYFRAGAALVLTLENSEELVLSEVEGVSSVAIENGPLVGSGVGVGSSFIPSATIGWRLPWMDGRLAIETILSTPQTIEFVAKGSLANESLAPDALGIPTGIPALGEPLGKTKVIPPIVTAVYRFAVHRTFTPYVGAGLSYLIPYDSHITNAVLTEVNEPNFKIDRSLGIVAQGGLEARVWRRLYIQVDIKYIGRADARATVTNLHVRAPNLPLYDTIKVGKATMNVLINPLIVQVASGWNF